MNRVCNLLKNFGVKVTYEDCRSVSLGEPDFTKVDELRDGQDDIIAALVANDRGIIKAPTGAGKSFLITQICKMWPEAMIIICCPFAGVVRQTYDELKKSGSFRLGEVGMVGDGKKETDARIQCVVDKSLMKCPLERCDIFMYDEVHRAAATKGAEVMAGIHNARRYGFSASPHGRSDNADMETEAMFGPLIIDMSYQEVQEVGSVVPIDVYMVPVETCETMVTANTMDMKRRALWRNQERNRIIAWAAKWAINHVGPDGQILITVETTEHAVMLGSLLPEFQLVYASMDAGKLKRWQKAGLISKEHKALSPDDRERLRLAFAAKELKYAICTGTWGTGLNFKYLNALIRADAQSGDILNTQIPGRVTRSTEGKEVGIVIDFDDLFHQTLEGRSRRRASGYKQKGWTIKSLQPRTYMSS